MGRTPTALDSLTPEQRYQVYKLLKLKVTANKDGTATLEADALPTLSCNLETLYSAEYVHTVNVLHEVKPIRPDFAVLVGLEDQILPALLAGTDGAISGLSNVAPGLFVDLVRSAREGGRQTAAELHRRVLSLTALGAHSDPTVGAIKLAMKELGVPVSLTVRGPALPAPPEAEEDISATLHAAGLLPAQREA